jgi:hypothetical protein
MAHPVIILKSIYIIQTYNLHYAKLYVQNIFKKK